MLVAARLAARGHAVQFVSDEASRAAAVAAGLPFASWRRAPNRTSEAAPDDPLDDWRHRWPPSVVRAVCDAVISGPALPYAQDTLEFVAEFQPDLVVTNELLFGVMLACERAGTRVVALTSSLWCFPTRDDVPPFGPGFGPPVQPGRDATVRRLITRLYDSGRPRINAARRALGLPDVAHAVDQLRVLDAVLLGTSRAFEGSVGPPPRPFVHVGPLLESPSATQDPTAAAAALLTTPCAGRPTVLVSFSTAWQNQGPMLASCVEALGSLPVAGIVTTGPAVAPGSLPQRANVTVVACADHDALLPACDLLVCQGGHGTLVRALVHGVPVLVIPSGRDHFDNAARVRARAAGLVLGRRPSPTRLVRAIDEVLRSAPMRANARTWGTEIAAEADGGRRAAGDLERLAASARATAVAADRIGP